MIKKQWLGILIIGIVSNILLMGNVFAATETSIEVNDLSINISRDLGETETYTVTTNDSLKSFNLTFSADNNVEVTRSGTSWTISAMYKGTSYSLPPLSSEGSFASTTINGKLIGVNVISAQVLQFTIDKDLSDAFFSKILDNHAAFTLEAESVNGKKVSVEREVSSGEDDAYTISSETEDLENAKVVDGTDEIIITKNGTNYDISGKYKEMSGSTSIQIGGGETTITYGTLTVGIEVADARTVTINADPAVVQEIIQSLLDAKRNITEVVVATGSVFEIPSNSNISLIEIPAGISDPKIQFTVSGNTTTTNKEITISDANTGMTVILPAGTTITGPAGWDGTIELPRSSTATLEISGYTTNIDEVIEIGLSSGSLTFDQPVKLVFPNKADKKIGFMIGGVFTEITTSCSGDTIPAGSAECKGTSGSDAFVLTNHFTKFIAYTQNVISYGGGGGGGGGSDITSPVISDIKVTAGTNSATITWNTNEASLSWILYGVSNAYGQESKNVSYTTSHSVTLTNLLPATTYHYQVKSEDTSKNSSVSADQSFMTLAAGKVIGDLNNDSKVDKYDFALMMANWGKTGGGIGDLNNDSKVDKYDFALMMANWTK